jgi:hypothetical protein
VTALQQRAFLLARKREREARLGGRPGGGGGRGGGYGSDGEGYGGEDDEYDSEDSFIDDDESGDWRRHLRSLTGEGLPGVIGCSRAGTCEGCVVCAVQSACLAASRVNWCLWCSRLGVRHSTWMQRPSS